MGTDKLQIQEARMQSKEVHIQTSCYKINLGRGLPACKHAATMGA